VRTTRESVGAGYAGDPNAGDPNAGDPNAGDPNAGDPNAGDPNAGDPNAGDPNAGDPNAGDPVPAAPFGHPPALATPPAVGAGYAGDLAPATAIRPSSSCGRLLRRSTDQKVRAATRTATQGSIRRREITNETQSISSDNGFARPSKPSQPATQSLLTNKEISLS
jgi:hypothetical protein